MNRSVIDSATSFSGPTDFADFAGFSFLLIVFVDTLDADRFDVAGLLRFLILVLIINPVTQPGPGLQILAG